MKIKNISTISTTFLFVLLCFGLFVACKKDSDGIDVKTGVSILKITTSIADFTNESKGAKTASVSPLLTNEDVMTNTIRVSKELTLVATLTPDYDNTFSSISKLASTNLEDDVWYRLLVFDKTTGNLLEERKYQRGKEGTDPNPLQLDGGVIYTFVAYSVSSTNEADLPAYTAATLSNSVISAGVNSELLYFKEDFTVSGEANDYLDIVFKRQNSQVTTVINVNGFEAGINIEAVSAMFEIPRDQASFNLATAEADWTGGAATTKTIDPFTILTDPTNRSARAVTTLFAKNETVRFLLTKLKVGSLNLDAAISGAPLKPFANTLTLAPGKKYTLTLYINPPAATIGAIDCANATLVAASTSTTPNLNEGLAFEGTVSIPYTGGNGGVYPQGAPQTINGLTFRLRAGSVTTAGGNLVYDVVGAPINATSISLPVGLGVITCTAYLPVTPNGALNTNVIPYGGNSTSRVLTIDGTPITVSYSDYVDVRQGANESRPVELSSCGLTNGYFWLMSAIDGYVGDPERGRMILKFSKPIGSLTIFQTGTNNTEEFAYTLRRNGQVVATYLRINAVGTCSQAFAIRNSNTIHLVDNTIHPYYDISTSAGVSYNVSSTVFFDEIEINSQQAQVAYSGGSNFQFMIGTIQP